MREQDREREREIESEREREREKERERERSCEHIQGRATITLSLSHVLLARMALNAYELW